MVCRSSRAPSSSSASNSGARLSTSPAFSTGPSSLSLCSLSVDHTQAECVCGTTVACAAMPGAHHESNFCYFQSPINYSECLMNGYRGKVDRFRGTRWLTGRGVTSACARPHGR
jgi:hypothetical protein